MIAINSSNLVVAESPFAIFPEIVSRRAPFFLVAIHGTVMVVFTIIEKWKDATISTRITAMGVHSAITLLCKLERIINQSVSHQSSNQVIY